MNMRVRFFSILICGLALFGAQSFAQSVRQGTSTPQGQEQLASLPPNSNSMEAVASEIDLLRKSVQTLSTRLREISDRLTPEAKENDSSTDKVRRISANIELLARTEERAGILRKQLLELIEKETSSRSRLAQIDEDIRPENIERALSGIGTTRTVELRETRRRVLENERKGLESLLNQTPSSRSRLEEDVRQADSLVTKLRQRLMPLIEREIEKINPN
ncbi:MAG: hypothetical protein DMF75_07720 [Acidobacteria bacterium]|nr:MAG: hypothetical protein DMF75_07720 [Acidobacteriota bacterium]